MYGLSTKKVAVVERQPLVELPLYLFVLSYFLLQIFCRSWRSSMRAHEHAWERCFYFAFSSLRGIDASKDRVLGEREKRGEEEVFG